MQLWEEKKDQGLVLLALAQESASEVEVVIEGYKPTYPIGAGSNYGNTYGITGFPTAVLVNHEGEIIWRDNFINDEALAMLDAALIAAEEASPNWDAGERPAALEKAVKSAKAGAMGKAWKESEALKAKAAADPALAAAVESFQKDFLARALKRTQKQEAFIASGRYHEATLYYEREIKVFDGSPPAEEWKALLAGWKKDPAAKQNQELDKKRLAALQRAREGDKDKALKELRSLLEKAEGLPIKQAIKETYDKVGMMSVVVAN